MFSHLIYIHGVVVLQLIFLRFSIFEGLEPNANSNSLHNFILIYCISRFNENYYK